MKRMFRRGTAFFLSLLLLCSFPVSVFASEAMGSEITSYGITLGKGTEYRESVFYGASISNLRQEHFVTYSPNTTVTPVVCYGEAVTDLAKPSAVAAQLEEDGYRVLMAMNGDFYNVSNGVPLGMVVSDGELKSGSGIYYALGFTADGEIVTGKPQLSFYAEWETDALAIRDFNKDREDDGAYLFSYDFNTRHTTGTTATGTCVVLALERGSMAIGETVRFTVEEVLTEYTGAVTIADEEHFVLTANENAPQRVQEALLTLEEGMELCLDISAADRAWERVQYATGALYALLEDGELSSDISSQSGSAPRTAIGIKKNGDIVFYTIDGRQSGYSLGAGYAQVAKRLRELGCVEAYALDGGGSTVMATSEPGFALAGVSKPSDGYERAVSTQIFLVAEERSTSSGGGLTVRPESRMVLAGAEVSLLAGAYDRNYTSLGTADAEFSASAGEISGNTLTAPTRGGDVTVYAEDGRRSGSTVIHVIDTPDSLSLFAGGKTCTSLSLQCGETVQLSAAAYVQKLQLLSQPQCFTWELSDAKLGSIDADGVLHCGTVNASGTLTVRSGETKLTVPVTLSGGEEEISFTDTEGSWAEEYICALCREGIVGGFEDGSFRPDNNLTRKQFAAMLYRALDLDDEDYEDVNLPFADRDGLIGTYAEIPVKALYSLGIISGAEEKGKLYFHGGEKLTRAQAAAMIGRAYDLYEEESLSFKDAKSVPNYAKGYVAALSNAGIIGGFSDGSFRPKQNLTRAQMCKILYFAMRQAGEQ